MWEKLAGANECKPYLSTVNGTEIFIRKMAGYPLYGNTGILNLNTIGRACMQNRRQDRK